LSTRYDTRRERVSTPYDLRRAERQVLRQQRRRRRYALIDSTAGVAIAIIGLIVAPGVGILALEALLVLAVCAATLIIGRTLRRRPTRRGDGWREVRAAETQMQSRRRSA
jgi:hypothetical protein